MAVRSKEFVGKAEGIKSHELSVKFLIESRKNALSRLNEKKNSFQFDGIVYAFADVRFVWRRR